MGDRARIGPILQRSDIPFGEAVASIVVRGLIPPTFRALQHVGNEPDGVAYCSWDIAREQRRMKQAPPGQPGSDERQTALTIVRAYIHAGKVEQARLLLRRLLTRYPEDDTAWLLLLSTTPPRREEIDILQGMLKHHPAHRFAPALTTRLAGLLEEQRILGVLEDVVPKPEPLRLPPQMRLGDFLVNEGWLTRPQIDAALAEQGRLTALGVNARLGTALLMQGFLDVGELAVALGAVSAFELGALGEFLVKNRVLAPVEVAAALAHQSLHAATLNQEYLDRRGGMTQRLGLAKRPRQPQPPPRLGEMFVELGLLSAEEVERHAQDCYRETNALFDD